MNTKDETFRNLTVLHRSEHPQIVIADIRKNKQPFAPKKAELCY